MAFNHSIIQSFNHSIIQSFNHSIIQSFNHSIIQSFNHSSNQATLPYCYNFAKTRLKIPYFLLFPLSLTRTIFLKNLIQ
ncbi:hypothetical protein KVE53_06580 [Helicobacter pylori]|nr:hypothetical protein KVE53_06580 [Helicobacter pylori]